MTPASHAYATAGQVARVPLRWLAVGSDLSLLVYGALSPSYVTMVTAAALPEVACTVFSNVFMVGRLRKGDVVIATIEHDDTARRLARFRCPVVQILRIRDETHYPLVIPTTPRPEKPEHGIC